ncbi:hypothetical protein P4O66_001218 [Electrophorus voltai]|uniref:Integrase catalytic domain-containing protein n=1 Tax=Electrophorus voltai TaxID=2609070 RepID=A0AAD9DUE3_9TELE|nr:hypothetical protein P4O66_001218 [Electrophorus voltai]
MALTVFGGARYLEALQQSTEAPQIVGLWVSKVNISIQVFPDMLHRIETGQGKDTKVIVVLLKPIVHQANGQIERVNQELGKFLRLYCKQHPETWTAYLSWVEYAQNSPCLAVNRSGRRRLRSANATYKRKADTKRRENPQYEPGDKVWEATRDCQADPKGKLQAREYKL